MARGDVYSPQVVNTGRKSTSEMVEQMVFQERTVNIEQSAHFNALDQDDQVAIKGELLMQDTDVDKIINPPNKKQSDKNCNAKIKDGGSSIGKQY